MSNSASKTDFRHLTILVADGNEYFCDLITSLLDAFRVGVVSRCNDGLMAWETLKKGQIDCLITEWRLEAKSGKELIETIRRESASTNRALPVILCTGYTEIDSILQARDAGVNAILAKPVSAEQLYKKLVDVLSERRQFVDGPEYVGPCRRRRNRPFLGPDRRTTLGQEEIDRLLAEN